jgi:hypothetical protein
VIVVGPLGEDVLEFLDFIKEYERASVDYAITSTGIAIYLLFL